MAMGVYQNKISIEGDPYVKKKVVNHCSSVGKVSQ